MCVCVGGGGGEGRTRIRIMEEGAAVMRELENISGRRGSDTYSTNTGIISRWGGYECPMLELTCLK